MTDTFSEKANKRLTTALGVLLLALLGVSVFSLARRGLDPIDPVNLASIGMDLIFLSCGALLYNSCIIGEEKSGGDFHSYMWLLYVSNLTIFFDLMKLIWEHEPGHRTILLFGVCGVFVGNIFLIYMFWLYVMDYFGMRESRGGRLADLVMRISVALGTVMCVGSIASGMYFVVDENANYERGYLYIVAMIYPLIMEALCLIGILINRGRVDGFRLISLLAFIIVPTIGQVLSIVFPGIAFVRAACTLSLLYMYCILNVDRGRRASGVRQELATAHSIQTSLLPSIFPAYPEREEFDICAKMLTAREVGGDMYDFFFVDGTRFAFGIGGVSGHGVPAALFMMVIRSLIKGRAQSGESPEGIIRVLKQHIRENNPGEMEVSVWIGIVDLGTGRMEYGGFGKQCGTVLFGGDEGRYEVMNSRDLGSALLCPGDRVFLYTRSLFDEPGEKRFLGKLNDMSDREDGTLVNQLTESVRSKYADGVPPADLTVLSFTFRKQTETTEGGAYADS